MPAWTTPGIALTCLLPAALHACLWTNPGVPLTFACMTREHGVTRRIDLVLRVYQAYAVSLGMYASQIWSTGFLHINNVFASEVQSCHLGFLRFLIKARHGTCRWTLLHELG